MSEFEDFIQTELPGRPFVHGPGEQGQILVRNGPGPRQTQWTDVEDILEGNTPTYLAGHDISGHRAVYLEGDTIRYADHTQIEHRHAVFGVTKNAAQEGDQVAVVQRGLLKEPSWTWVPKNPIFVGAEGNLTQDVPTTGFALVLGYAVSETEINVRIGRAIIME